MLDLAACFAIVVMLVLALAYVTACEKLKGTRS